jgi:hypothetical protein
MKNYLIAFLIAFISFGVFAENPQHTVTYQHIFEGWEKEKPITFEKNGGTRVFHNFTTKSSSEADFKTIITFKGDLSDENLWEIEIYIIMMRGKTGLEVTQITPKPAGRKKILIKGDIHTQVDFDLTTTGDNNGHPYFNTVYYSVMWLGDKDIVVPWKASVSGEPVNIDPKTMKFNINKFKTN